MEDVTHEVNNAHRKARAFLYRARRDAGRLTAIPGNATTHYFIIYQVG